MAAIPAVSLQGAPLMGKGTLAQALIKHYPTVFSWWESSTILKSYATTHNDERAQAVNEIFSGEKIISSKLLNDEDLAAIIADYAATHNNGRIPLLDGVIRTAQQAQYLTPTVDVKTVLYLDSSNVQHEEVARRVVERNRPGETIEQALERIRIAHEKTEPLLEFYGSKVFRLDAAKTKSRVFTDARAHVRHVFNLAY